MKKQKPGGGILGFIGSAIIIGLVKFFGGVANLFHMKGTYSNGNAEERELMSGIVKEMKKKSDR